MNAHVWHSGHLLRESTVVCVNDSLFAHGIPSLRINAVGPSYLNEATKVGRLEHDGMVRSLAHHQGLGPTSWSYSYQPKSLTALRMTQMLYAGARAGTSHPDISTNPRGAFLPFRMAMWHSS